MIRGAPPTVFVSDMDRAVAFDTESLVLALAFRAGEHWAKIDAGNGTEIGLHPRTDRAPAARFFGLGNFPPVASAPVTVIPRT